MGQCRGTGEATEIRATLYRQASDLHWPVDPSALLEALAMGRRPPALPPLPSVMQVKPGV